MMKLSTDSCKLTKTELGFLIPKFSIKTLKILPPTELSMSKNGL